MRSVPSLTSPSRKFGGGASSTRCEAPRTVRYDDDVSRRLLFTQSGRLHVVDSATGTEVWSFVPAPLLSDPRSPGDATPDARRDGGLAAEPRLHRFDANGDGLIRRDDGDHVWLLFGLAATPVFYALNRGKRFVSIDGTNDRGRAVLADLAASADVFLHNIRPGKPDLDNVVKLIMDALNGVVVVDDKQVAVMTASKRYDAVAETGVEVMELI